MRRRGEEVFVWDGDKEKGEGDTTVEEGLGEERVEEVCRVE